MTVAGLYARVSTSDKGQDVTVQLQPLRAYAAQRQWEATEYVDEGVSGAREKRPALDRLIADIRRGKINVVCVARLDRLGRSLRHLITLLTEWNERGVMFVSLADQIDLTTSTGRLMFHIIGALAEFERALIADRVRAGMSAARARGVRLGRRPTVNADQTKAILDRRARGESFGAIARALQLPKTTVHAVVQKSLRNSGSQALENSEPANAASGVRQGPLS